MSPAWAGQLPGWLPSSSAGQGRACQALRQSSWLPSSPSQITANSAWPPSSPSSTPTQDSQPFQSCRLTRSPVTHYALLSSRVSAGSSEVSHSDTGTDAPARNEHLSNRLQIGAIPEGSFRSSQHHDRLISLLGAEHSSTVGSATVAQHLPNSSVWPSIP